MSFNRRCTICITHRLQKHLQWTEIYFFSFNHNTFRWPWPFKYVSVEYEHTELKVRSNMSFFHLTLTLTKWSWYLTLTYIWSRCICVLTIKYLAIAVQKLQPEHTLIHTETKRYTDKPNWNYYLSAYGDGKNHFRGDVFVASNFSSCVET